MNATGIKIIEGFQLLIALFILGISIDCSVLFYTGGTPSQTAMMIFTACWSVIAGVYLMFAPLYFSRLNNLYARVTINAISTVFWMISFIWLAYALNGVYHPDHVIYFDDNSSDVVHRFYEESIVTTIFGVIEGLLFGVTTIYAAIYASHDSNATYRVDRTTEVANDAHDRARDYYMSPKNP